MLCTVQSRHLNHEHLKFFVCLFDDYRMSVFNMKQTLSLAMLQKDY